MSVPLSRLMLSLPSFFVIAFELFLVPTIPVE